MRVCDEAQLETAVLWPERASVSLHALCVWPLPTLLWATQRCCSDGAFSPALSESKWHPASVEMKIFLAVGSSLANTPCSSFLVSSIYFFSSFMLDSIWSAVARRVSCVPVIWSSLTVTSFNFWFLFDVLCPLPIYPITFLLFLLV